MPPDSEIVCPFCGHRQALVGDALKPFVFEGYGDFDLYRCPCGAVGSPSGDIGEAGWPLDDVEEALCKGFLQAERGACHLDINHVTQTDPPMLMLWAKRRASEPPPSGQGAKP